MPVEHLSSLFCLRRRTRGLSRSRAPRVFFLNALSSSPRSKREVNCAHQADLVEQIKQQRRRHAEWKAHEEREYQLGLMEQEMYLQRKEEVLSKDASHAAAQHPFRRADASRAAPLLPT